MAGVTAVGLWALARGAGIINQRRYDHEASPHFSQGGLARVQLQV